MRNINAQELRNLYRQYMKEQGHTLLKSASLVSQDQVLFITAGVHPIINEIASGFHPLGGTLASIQPCVRTGDIEEVGDNTHFTSFEMLGYWSLGIYETERAIRIAYEFLTGVLGIQKEYLTSTVFEGDDMVPADEVAENVWQSLGVPTTRHGRSDNWWGPVSESGPCGPDTEIFFWTGEGPPGQFDPTLDSRWVEIWNIVSMSMRYLSEGRYEPLPKPVIDTGGGLERILSVATGKNTAFQTDLFDLSFLCDIADRRIRIVADHIRTSVRLINSGVTPSRQKHGSVLRRLVRRALLNFGLLENTATDILLVVALDLIRREDSEYMNKTESQIIEVLSREIVSSLESFRRSRDWFSKLTRDCRQVISGDLLFQLHSEKGCPVELLELLAAERNLSIDLVDLRRRKEDHRKSSRVGA